MPEPTLETDLPSASQIWWQTGRLNGAAAMRVFGNRLLTSSAGLQPIPLLTLRPSRSIWRLARFRGLAPHERHVRRSQSHEASRTASALARRCRCGCSLSPEYVLRGMLRSDHLGLHLAWLPDME